MPQTKYDKALQFAALPWRLTEDGARQVMLLTSRETGRWVIPKGWPMKRLKPSKAAEQEAFEEAGLVGHIAGKRPIGVYHYEKRLPAGGCCARSGSSCCGSTTNSTTGPRRISGRPSGWTRRRPPLRVEEGALAEIILHTFANNVFSPGTRRRKTLAKAHPSLFQPQPAWQQVALVFQHRIGRGGDQMRVDPFEVAQDIEMQRAGLGDAHAAGAQALEMGLAWRLPRRRGRPPSPPPAGARRAGRRS